MSRVYLSSSNHRNTLISKSESHFLMYDKMKIHEFFLKYYNRKSHLNSVSFINATHDITPNYLV